MGASAADQWLDNLDLRSRSNDLELYQAIAIRALRKIAKRTDATPEIKGIAERAIRRIDR